PVDRSMKGCGAWGNSRRAAARSPPCSSDPAFKWDIMAAALTLLALLIEAMAGYPDRLVRSICPPVIWMGSLIAGMGSRWESRHWNPDGIAKPGPLRCDEYSELSPFCCSLALSAGQPSSSSADS